MLCLPHVDVIVQDLGLEAEDVEGGVEGVGEGDVQVLVQRGAYRRVGRG